MVGVVNTGSSTDLMVASISSLICTRCCSCSSALPWNRWNICAAFCGSAEEHEQQRVQIREEMLATPC